MKPQPFYFYTVTDEDRAYHSSIYYPEIKEGQTKTPDEIREELLIILSAACCEHEFPEHGDNVTNNPTITLYGPFNPGDPIDQLTHAEYNAIDEDVLP